MNGGDLRELLDQYYVVWQEYNAVYEEWAKRQGLSVNGLLVLCAMEDGGEDCTQKKISQRWRIPKQTVNMVLKEFERKGLVQFFPMREDRRNKAIRFTEAGRDYAEGILSRLRKAELFAIGEMGVEKMEQLNESMALFARLFREAGGNYETGK